MHVCFVLYNAGNVEILKLIYLKNKKYLHALAADGELDCMCNSYYNFINKECLAARAVQSLHCTVCTFTYTVTDSCTADLLHVQFRGMHIVMLRKSYFVPC